jgi:hypothetical protein
MSLKVTVPQQKTVEKQLVDYKAFWDYEITNSNKRCSWEVSRI